MKRHISFILATSFLILVSLSTAIQATVLQKKSFEDLVLQADLAAIGQVLAVESYPTSDNQYAYTYVTVGGLEILKGTYPSSSIRLRMDGGALPDGSHVVIPGIPTFQPGEKVVVFVKGNGKHFCPLVGWEQGLLRVVQDQTTGQEVLKTSHGRAITMIQKGDFVVSSTAVYNKAQDSAGIPDDGQAPSVLSQSKTGDAPALTLEQLKAQVRSTLTFAGPKALFTAEVRSADITLDAPGPQQIQNPTRRK